MKLYTYLDYYRMKPQFLPEGVEVIRGETPSGGAFAVALFQDASGNRVPKEQAVKIEIVECDADGKALFHTYMNKK